MHDQLSHIVNEMIDNGIEYRLGVQEFEAMYIRHALLRHQGNVSATAVFLGLHRNTLTRKMKTLALEKVDGGNGETY